ncbi:unnamed protein product, partial [Symbiodinium necroappetens]
VCSRLQKLEPAFELFRLEAQFKEPSRLFRPFLCGHFGSKRSEGSRSGTIEDRLREREGESERERAPGRAMALLLKLSMLAVTAAALPAFPPSWGSPPEIMTMDYGPLAGGYGHGSSSLSTWIYQNMQEDLSAGRPQYPPDFGPPPKAQTRDLRPLPFGYGFGSGTMAKWLTKKAKEVYNETPEDFEGIASALETAPGGRRDLRPTEVMM